MYLNCQNVDEMSIITKFQTQIIEIMIVKSDVKQIIITLVLALPQQAEPSGWVTYEQTQSLSQKSFAVSQENVDR